jgi:hypothetical protein
MTTAKRTINTGEQQDLWYRAARFNEKGCFASVGVEMLLVRKESFKFSLCISNRLHCQKFPVFNFSDLTKV